MRPDPRLHHSWTVLALARCQFLLLARHWGSSLGVLLLISHTHLDGKCVLAAWQEFGGEICCRKKKKAGIFAKSLATSRILIINFYSEYNVFAHEETQFFLSSIINIDQFCTSFFFFSVFFFFTRQILVSQIKFHLKHDWWTATFAEVAFGSDISPL